MAIRSDHGAINPLISRFLRSLEEREIDEEWKGRRGRNHPAGRDLRASRACAHDPNGRGGGAPGSGRTGTNAITWRGRAASWQTGPWISG